ncbi:hypothetical protein O1611_g3182 [Lasiodiplodia mahajangana]|uniref:Uncharacterized protein n=1 Tax=Lasiodiplodia mahajangana TaxID=1108764 RepID=A0ACC2JTD4_9PEZI|nr:hypothetical protein O1611_g3182 [Lasiodiplodia mahajangana]
MPWRVQAGTRSSGEPGGRYCRSDQPTTDRKSKIKEQGEEVALSIQSPKARTAGGETAQYKHDASISVAVTGISGAEKLATLEAASHDISSDFLVVGSQISGTSIPLQGIHSTLSGFETRFNSFENLLKQLLI